MYLRGEPTGMKTASLPSGGETMICCVGSLRMMYSSKSIRISFRSTGTLTDKVSGKLPKNLGGISSLGPPDGVPCRAQEKTMNTVRIYTKKRINKNCCKLIKNQTAQAMVSTLILTVNFE